jgi:hypothetical protein
MNEDDKIDLIAAILAVGLAENTGHVVGTFRRIRSQLKTEGLDDPTRAPKPPEPAR